MRRASVYFRIAGLAMGCLVLVASQGLTASATAEPGAAITDRESSDVEATALNSQEVLLRTAARLAENERKGGELAAVGDLGPVAAPAVGNVEVWKARDRHGFFVVFAMTPPGQDVVGIASRDGSATEIVWWTRAEGIQNWTRSARVAEEAWAIGKAGVGPDEECKQAVEALVGAIIEAICAYFGKMCENEGIVGGGLVAGAYICRPTTNSAYWSSGDHIETRSQCCGSPYYTTADVGWFARGCDPRSYGTPPTDKIRYSCWEPGYYGVQKKTAEFRATYHWPDQTADQRLYSCACTWYSSDWPTHTNYNPRSRWQHVFVDEAIYTALGKWVQTGRVMRKWNFT